MSDLSERFAETRTCGCSWHAGSWDPCAQHRAGPSVAEQARHAVGQPHETPDQHIKNALMILAVAEADVLSGRRTLTSQEYAAIRTRLERAIAQLEGRP